MKLVRKGGRKVGREVSREVWREDGREVGRDDADFLTTSHEIPLIGLGLKSAVKLLLLRCLHAKLHGQLYGPTSRQTSRTNFTNFTDQLHAKLHRPASRRP